MENTLFENVFKIGKSCDVKRRHITLNTMHEDYIKPYLLFRHEKRKVDVFERVIHRKYERQNCSRNSSEEWFCLSDKDISDIKYFLFDKGFDECNAIEMIKNLPPRRRKAKEELTDEDMRRCIRRNMMARWTTPFIPYSINNYL